MRHSIDRPFVVAVMIVTAIFFALPLWLGMPTAAALGDPCALDPNNLIVNGSMAAADPDEGIAANWSPFTLSGDPTFEHVDNEQIDPNGSQYIWEDIYRFDAGVYQTVTGLEPGSAYHFWLGYALAAYDPGDGHPRNERGDWIGRQVGYDLTGGTNPLATTVTWGDVYCDGTAAVNIPVLSKTFVATTGRATIFLRAINAKEQWPYRNKVWFDSVCMEPTTARPQTADQPSDTGWLLFIPFVRISPPVAPASCLVGIAGANPATAHSPRAALGVVLHRPYTPWIDASSIVRMETDTN